MGRAAEASRVSWVHSVVSNDFQVKYAILWKHINIWGGQDHAAYTTEPAHCPYARLKENYKIASFGHKVALRIDRTQLKRGFGACNYTHERKIIVVWQPSSEISNSRNVEIFVETLNLAFRLGSRALR